MIIVDWVTFSVIENMASITVIPIFVIFQPKNVKITVRQQSPPDCLKLVLTFYINSLEFRCSLLPTSARLLSGKLSLLPLSTRAKELSSREQ